MVMAIICGVAFAAVAWVIVEDFAAWRTRDREHKTWLRTFIKEDEEMNKRLDKLFDEYKPKQ